MRRRLAGWLLELAAWVDEPAPVEPPRDDPSSRPGLTPEARRRRSAALAETVDEEEAALMLVGGAGTESSPLRYVAIPEPRHGRTWVE